MAGEEQEGTARRHEAPPAAPGEPIHLPGPSYLPVIVAFGLTIALVGVVVNFWLLVIGMVTTIVAIARWVGQARAEIAELPLEHRH
jgi:type IV secretory pathway TrbD component